MNKISYVKLQKYVNYLASIVHISVDDVIVRFSDEKIVLKAVDTFGAITYLEVIGDMVTFKTELRVEI